MFRFFLQLLLLIQVFTRLTSFHESTIEDAFQGQDMEDNTFINDGFQQQELIHQAETLLFEQSPLIEQMLAMADSIGDVTNDQMLMLISDAEHEVPDYAVLQSPISDTRIFESHSKPKIEMLVSEEPEWLAHSEFFLGALIVFIAFPILLNAEQRKYKNVMIMKDVNELCEKRQLIYIQGSTIVTQEYLIDSLTGIRAQNVLRFYRRVEELLENHQGERRWIEREGDVQWYDENGLDVVNSKWKSQIFNNECILEGYQINDNQLEQLENWCKLKIYAPYYPEYNVENNNIYIDRLRISYWYIPSQLLTIVCNSYGNQLNPIEIHIPLIESTQDINQQNSASKQPCQEQICQKVCQWIQWNEWPQEQSTIDFIEEGLISLEEMFQIKMSFQAMNLFLHRAITFLMMLIGIWMFFLPIYQVLSLFPMFGQLDIGPYLGAIVGFLFASVFWLTTVGISICFYNKPIGITLLSLSILIVVVLIFCSHFDFQIDPSVFNKYKFLYY